MLRALRAVFAATRSVIRDDYAVVFHGMDESGARAASSRLSMTGIWSSVRSVSVMPPVAEVPVLNVFEVIVDRDKKHQAMRALGSLGREDRR